jgi:glycosyltransferase involved in cell wall biosynthesis
MSTSHAAEPSAVIYATGQQTHAPRVLIDCTQTLATPRLAGIPRVVRSIARHGVAAAAVHGATIVPVRFEDDHFITLSLSSSGDIVDVVKRPSASNAHPVLRRLHKLLVPRTIVRSIRTQWRRLLRIPLPGAPIEFGPNDTLLLADSSWATRYWHVVDRAREAGTRVGVVQYDFIPHTHPELVPKKLPATYRGWMQNTLTRADFVAAISEAVAVEARAELRQMGRDPERAAPLVQAFRLGADVKPPAKAGTVRRELVDFLAASPVQPYLTVGTIEPRKNQTILPAVFEEVWRQVPDARLLVAGFVGWKGDELIRRLHSHPRYGTHLMHFGDLSDAELLHAYAHARALIFPSRAEGYGLPIVESLSHGMRVFASDIPAHREVGGPWCVYFAPGDVSALAGHIVRWERDGVFPAAQPEGSFASPTWQQATEQLMRIVFSGTSADARHGERAAA